MDPWERSVEWWWLSRVCSAKPFPNCVRARMCDHLKSCVHRFSDLRNRIQDEYREVVERRLRTITGGAGGGWWTLSFPRTTLCKNPYPSPVALSREGVVDPQPHRVPSPSRPLQARRSAKRTSTGSLREGRQRTSSRRHSWSRCVCRI